MLNDSQLAFFRDNGYLVVPDVVPDRLCDQVIDAILEYTGVDLDDPSTWYRSTFEGHGIVPLHHHQALWELRQHPTIHAAFADLYGTRNLWVSNDRVSYKPPAGEPTRSIKREPVHWDCDPWQLDYLSMQGLVYLNDTAEDQGAFMCAPGIYRNLREYLRSHEHDEHRRRPAVTEDDLVRVAGSKGSLVVFNRLIPHTSDLNTSPEHRFVQYVTMAVADESKRDLTIREWRERLLPDWALRQKISGGRTKEEGPPPRLTAHGRKLVGLDPW